MGGERLAGSFWRFWAAAVLANVGDGIRVAAFPLLAASLTGSPVGVAVVGAAQFVPWLVTGLLAGALADRRPTRQVIALADTARVLVLGLLVVAVATGHVTITLVAASAFVLGMGETVRDTAAQTAVPRLVPKPLLERANGRLVAGEVVGNEFVGPTVGSVLFVVGAAVPFAVNGASLALAVMLVLSLPLSLARLPVGAVSPVGIGIRDGLRWLARHQVLRTFTLASAAVAAADSAWWAVFVLFVGERMDAGALGFGGLLAVGAAGGLAGSVVAERLIGGRRHRAVLAWAIAVTGGVPLLLVASSELWAGVAVVVLTSGAFAVLNVAGLSLRHRLVPDGLVGRITAAQRTLTYSGAAAGAVLGGVVAGAAGLAAPFVLCGLLAAVAVCAWVIATRPSRLGGTMGL